MLVVSFVLLTLHLDPLFIANVVSGKEPEKIMIVKMHDTNLQIFSHPEKYFEKVPVYLTQQISHQIQRCIRENITETRNILKCFSDQWKNGEVFYIRTPRKLRTLGVIDDYVPIQKINEKLKESDDEVGASQAREIYKVSGKKSIVGIIDTGVKWDSELLSFKMKDDISSIISDSEERNFSKAVIMWDQRNLRDPSVQFPKNGTYPSGFTYGFECREPARRSEILPGYNKCQSEDRVGHGTHIAGIVSMEAGEDIGISPDSILIVVPTNLYEDEVVDAVKYIFMEAERLKLPAVVNISLGGHFGPHDGTSLFEILLTQELGEGKIIVAAAGNEGREKIHIGGKFSGTLSSVVSIRNDCEIQFWFPPNSEAQIEVKFRGYSGKVSKGERKILFSGENNASLIDFTSSADVPLTYLLKYSLSDQKESAVFVSIGNVGQAQINITLPKENEFDAWVSSDPSDCFFTELGDLKPNFEKTIAIPATAKDIIAVGYYITEGENKGKISPNSSIGSDTLIKPNITAPGTRIFSICNSSDEYLCSGSGSSQATPHVSGAISLALERNHKLTPTDVIEALCKSAKKDEFTGQTPNKVWGCGKLRIPEFLSYIIPQSKAYSEYKIYYSTKSETKFNNTFSTLELKSDYPFRVLGPNLQNLGWIKNHKFYMKSIPEYIDIEFADGNLKRLNLVGEGIKIQDGLPRSCGCFATSKYDLFSLTYFFILLIISIYILRMRIKTQGK
ncbi:MAG: S8 family serine peptidase [bacterium]|nr:S8 family serine peptidase [bacterium]